MSEQNGKRVAGRQSRPERGTPNKKPSWRVRYKRWLAGMTRGQRIRYRLLQAATILAVIIIIGSVALGSWMKMPDIPSGEEVPLPDGSGSQATLDGDLSFDGAVTPHISESGRKKGVYTFLVVGQDVASGSTDTILLLSYDVNAKTVGGLSIPRDTMMNVDSYNKRINAIYFFNRGSDEKTQTQKGMAALKKAVADVTGITPDYYALVQWDAVGRLVEAINGVDFEVPFDMDYDDPAQDLHIHLKKGMQHLNGSGAMQVVRWRQNNDGSNSGGGDITRVSIQQDFLKAVAKRCLQPSIFLKIPDLARIFTENVETDLTVGNILALAQKAVGMDPEKNLVLQTAPWAQGFYYSGMALLTLDPDGILEFVNEYMNPYLRDVERSDLGLLIRNSNGTFSVTSGRLSSTIAGNHSSSYGGGTTYPSGGATTWPSGGTTTPGTTTPGGTTPGTTTPGGTTPGTTTPGTVTPGTTDPGGEDPGTTDPGTTDPGTVTPGGEDPGVTPGGEDPGTTTPVTPDPGPADPGTTTPVTPDPGPAAPGGEGAGGSGEGAGGSGEGPGGSGDVPA